MIRLTILSHTLDFTNYNKMENRQKNIYFSHLSYGYVTTQIIGGRMTEIFGVKRVYGFCLLGTAILTLLSPIAAKLHVAAFIAVRVLQGGKFWHGL